MKTNLPKRAVLYARFSPRPNGEESESIETQAKYLTDWCNGLGWPVAAQYEDRELSGKTMKGRAGLEAALEHVCRIRGVLCVYSLSRLARNVKDSYTILERLHKSHADLASLHEVLATNTPMGRAFFGFQSIMHALEREQIAERTSEGMLRHQSNGRRMGRIDRLPFGMRLKAPGIDSTALEPDEAEQAAIARMKALEATGATPRAICRELDKEGVERRGKTWENAHCLVSKILRR